MIFANDESVLAHTRNDESENRKTNMENDMQNLQDGDIVFYHDDNGVIYDVGMIETETVHPAIVMRFRPFRGRVSDFFPASLLNVNYSVYRYVGRKDNPKADEEVRKEAMIWFKRWRQYRYSAHFWILLSRIPIVRHWIRTTDDLSKVKADWGFTSSTSIAWAFEIAGADLVPSRSPDLTSVGDLARCAMLVRIY